jgi:glycosyltransferase involved in cell wall biosynthesis
MTKENLRNTLYTNSKVVLGREPSGICLNMIVKNETAVLERLFLSVAPVIDYFVIVDTGSTDGTPEFIMALSERLGVQGEVHFRDWVNFGHNRQQALDIAVAAGKGHWLLFIDADEELKFNDLEFINKLKHGTTYQLKKHNNSSNIRYALPNLLDITKNQWQWRGAVHECIVNVQGPDRRENIDDAWILFHPFQGVRSQGITLKEKFLRDALLLEAELLLNPNDTRSRFYLAQSYRSADEPIKAMENYALRAKMGGWQEEVFYSLYQIAKLKEQLAHPDDEVLAAYAAATAAQPNRAEAIHAAARFCRIKKYYLKGYELAKSALQMKSPVDALFGEYQIYTIGLLDEFAVNAYWAGYYAESLEACLKLIESGFLDEAKLDRIKANANFARRKLEAELQDESIVNYSNSPRLAEIPQTGSIKDDIRRLSMSRKRICLNMIVKNEVANLDRCLEAVAEHIDCWVICDTGSTDGTQQMIRAFFDKRSIPGELHSAPFITWEQARNAALDYAEASKLDFDYILFCDADMQLKVDKEDFRDHLEMSAYSLMQRTVSGLAYFNTRIVKRGIGVRYRGVTHEYVEVAGGTKKLLGVWYLDHQTGSNRVEKFERDIALLLRGLESDPNNHRYWYYLAQSYFDANQTAKAAETYGLRADMVNGWKEETWHARLKQARCFLKLGNEAGFVQSALTAFNQRPWRAEPLYDLAKHYRLKEQYEISAVFAEAGLSVNGPGDDVLFIEDNVYQYALLEEYSIAANYSFDTNRKARGFYACDSLALSRNVSQNTRSLARRNLYFYLSPAIKLMPSFETKQVDFNPPANYRACNPSIMRQGARLLMAQRSVNFLLENGQYSTHENAPVHTRNFLLELSPDLSIQQSREILEPFDLPTEFGAVLGFEDLRIFIWEKQLWAIACVRQLNREGWCEQVLARIEDADGALRLTDWRQLIPSGPKQHEKNWIPAVVGEALYFIYSNDPTRILDKDACDVYRSIPEEAAERFSGSSQAINFDGGWLAVLHERDKSPHSKGRFYQHRFAWYSANFELQKISHPFYFHKKGIEFNTGLAWHLDGTRLLLSYGVDDRESWIATVSAEDVRAQLALKKQKCMVV